MSHPQNPAAREAGRTGSWLDRARDVQDKPWWPWTRRLLVLVFFVVVAGLLFNQASKIDWSKVGESMRQQTASTLAIAGLLALASHAVYSSFDLFGRRVTGHELPTLKVMATTFVSYVFNLNVGILIGGLGFRYRLYARQGLPAEMTTTVIATSMLTNWLGFMLLGGALLTVRPPEVPNDWLISSAGLRLTGIVMLGLAAAWQLACIFSR
ncbi:MAG: YbhN family protein, partial [Ideonella sp.]